MGHAGLPKVSGLTDSKTRILRELQTFDSDSSFRDNCLALENMFRSRVQESIDAMPDQHSELGKFNTSPFVLLLHAFQRGYQSVSEIERDIVLAKAFSSMETAAGRMVEEITIPHYGWERVPSGMHTAYSSIDGKKKVGQTLYLTTLKSGPRCLNDEMSQNFADNIVDNYRAWAQDHNVRKIDYTYGVLYGTPKLSNKKDWHILRNVIERLASERSATIIIRHENSWKIKFSGHSIEVEVSVRVGKDWWLHLGGAKCLYEVIVSLIRSCITTPRNRVQETFGEYITNLKALSSFPRGQESYNISLLQRNQMYWFLLTLSHFVDSFTE